MNGEAQPCEVGSQCKNSPDNAGEAHTKCHWCVLSPANVELPAESKQYWRPLVPGGKHPILEKRKRAAKLQQVKERARSRHERDRGKQKLLQQAKRAEEKTQRKFIAATRNSGRSNKDADHLLGGRITLDTKLQSQREHPVVDMLELWKVNQDAVRAGSMCGALVLRPKSGEGIVALRERDFSRLLQMLGLKEEQA